MWFRRFSGLDCESVAGRRRAATATICALVLGLWSLLVVGAPVRAQAAPPTTSQTPSSGSELVDRVLAVVDADPILLSDISRVVELGQVERRDGEEERAYRRRVLDTLIEQRLRFHEVERFGFGDVPLEEVEAQFAEIRARFADEESFRTRLAAVGLDEAGLRQMVARQLLVLAFVEERLGPRVFVGLEEIRRHYDEVFVPELAARGEPAPPIEKVREQIRLVVREQRLNEEIARWTEELRREADVADYFDREARALPPMSAGKPGG